MHCVKSLSLILAAACCALTLAGCTPSGTAQPSAAPQSVSLPQSSAAPEPTATPSAAPTPTPLPQDTATPAPGYTAAGLEEVLNGCLTVDAGSAGSSLKAAIAADGLIRYLGQYAPGNETALEQDAGRWYAALDGEDLEKLQADWPGVYSTASLILQDPAAQAGLLESAGLSAEYGDLDLQAAGQGIELLDRVLEGTGADSQG